MKPCDGNHAPGQCRVCWLYDNDAAYRALWAGVEPAPAAPRSLPCIFLGAVIAQDGCPCPARWLRGCAVHGVCRLEQCKSCNDYQPED
jgi:hypothetical protein